MIRYIGAKNIIKDWVIETNQNIPSIWVEPFGGMFSIYFSLDIKKFPNTRFIYNDINPYHLNLFQHLKDPNFRRKLKSESLDNSSYLRSFSHYKKNGQEGAISWLRILSGSKDIRNILNPEYDGCWSWWKFIDSLDSLEEHFDRMEIENLNYNQCIKKWDNGNTFFYLDPPYFGYEHYYTYHNFNIDEHQKLRDIIYNIEGDWILSYYNFPNLIDWYGKYTIQKRKINLGTEYLISKKES